jgi:energy-converting hydrogenase A subunit M
MECRSAATLAKERIQNFMSDKASQSRIAQLEHAVTTVLACLSMIKYNAVLGEEQKKELVGDIDTTLQFLRDSLIAEITPEKSTANAQSGAHGSPLFDDIQFQDEIAKKHQQTIQALYRVYHMYLTTEQGNTLGSFVVRFHEIMMTIDDVQSIFESNQGGYELVADALARHVSAEDHLHRVRGFIADLYYVFMEFVRALARVLQVSDAHIDTEEISLTQKNIAENVEEYKAKALNAPAGEHLTSIYEMHRQVQATQSTLARRISDSQAFLAFLQERLAKDRKEREEILVQLHAIGSLLNELSQLLTGYGQAVSTLLEEK